MARIKRSRLLRKTRLEVMEERIAMTVQPWAQSANESHLPQPPLELHHAAADFRVDQHSETVEAVVNDVQLDQHSEIAAPVADFVLGSEFVSEIITSDTVASEISTQ